MLKDKRRLKILRISPHLFIEFCKYGTGAIDVIENVLPLDTKLVRIFMDDATPWGYIGIVIESQDFPEIEEPNIIPDWPLPVFAKRE